MSISGPEKREQKLEMDQPQRQISIYKSSEDENFSVKYPRKMCVNVREREMCKIGGMIKKEIRKRKTETNLR